MRHDTGVALAGLRLCTTGAVMVPGSSARVVATIWIRYVGLVSGVPATSASRMRGHDAGGSGGAQGGEMPIISGSPNWSPASQRGRLDFTTDLATLVRDADAVFIAWNAVARRGDGYADLSYVYAAAEEISSRSPAYRREYRK